MADREQVIQALRATLISVKGALTVQQCNRDYKELQGEWIPFRKLGYSTLQELFLEIPGFKITERHGDLFVDAIASQESQHIADMVSQQRTAKKTTSKFHHSSRYPKNQESWRKPSSSYKTNEGSPFNNNKYSNEYSKPVRSVMGPPTTDHTEKTTNYSEAKTNNSTSRPAREDSIRTENNHSGRPEPKVQASSKVSATQRLLTLRDHLNTMDPIPLQLPASSNEYEETSCSASVTHVAPADLRHDVEPLPDTTSSVVKLEWTCRKLGLPPPVYKMQDIRLKHGPISYASSCKVGTMHFASSYPDTAASQELAQEIVALKLLAVIESSEVDAIRTSSNDKALSCLAKLVSEHEAGLWATMVPQLYRNKFGENLPSNWLELVEHCSRIKMDRLANGLVLLPNNEETQLSPKEMADDTYLGYCSSDSKFI